MILAQIDLTTGSIPKTLLRFAFPMICGNLLQQLYNVADTLIVGRFLGSDALGAVGSSYTLMTFLTSILLGLCMGSGALFSVCWGAAGPCQTPAADACGLRAHRGVHRRAQCGGLSAARCDENAPVRPGGGLAPDAVVSVRHFLRHRRDVFL